MASRALSRRRAGFSLVEMLVALLFTGLLMAGMAQVFKSSLGSFTTSGEILSAARRNRSSIDLLYDDLNSAGMYLTELALPPKFNSANPGFYILPNQAVAGSGADGPATADQLLFYFDQPLAFEGRLGNPNAAKDNNTAVLDDASITNDNRTFTIDCLDPAYADLVQPGMSIFFKDFGTSMPIQSASASGSSVTIVGGMGSISKQVAGRGYSDAGQKGKHIMNSGIIFFIPDQMVRYSIKMKVLDPAVPGGVPCLVRDQGTYADGGFVAAPALESIITENVSGFKVYLSANAGQTWAGYGAGYSGLSAGWDNGIKADLNTQLVTAGRQDFTSIKSTDDIWFRRLPVLVRLDITTRSATKRPEYYRDPVTGMGSSTIAAFKDVTQSLVIVPRHFGLPIL